MLFFLLLIAWQNMIVGLCCCCCYCCFCKLDTIFSLSSITGRPHPTKKTGQVMYLSQNTNKLLPRFWPNLFYKKHFCILARCPRLASENAPDTTDSTSHLPELKKNSRRQVIFYLQHPYIHAMIINKTHQPDVSLMKKQLLRTDIQYNTRQAVRSISFSILRQGSHFKLSY